MVVSTAGADVVDGAAGFTVSSTKPTISRTALKKPSKKLPPASCARMGDVNPPKLSAATTPAIVKLVISVLCVCRMWRR